MSKNKDYTVNIVGACRNCVFDLTKHRWRFCFTCEALLCPTHCNDERICELCVYYLRVPCDTWSW